MVESLVPAKLVFLVVFLQRLFQICPSLQLQHKVKMYDLEEGGGACRMVTLRPCGVQKYLLNHQSKTEFSTVVFMFPIGYFSLYSLKATFKYPVPIFPFS